MAQQKNADKPARQEVAIDPPELKDDDDRPVEDLRVDQQWRDAEAANLGQLHPQSLNPDSKRVKKAR